MRLNLLKAFRNSFQVKVISVSIFFMLVICVVLTVYFVQSQRTSQNDALIGRSQLLAGTLAHSAKVGIFSENTDLLKDPIGGVAQHEEVACVVVYNSAGTLLSKSQDPQKMATIQSFPVTEKIDDALLGKLRRSGSLVYFTTPEALQVWSPVFSTSGYTAETSLFFGEGDSQKNTRVIGFIGITLSKGILNKQLYSFLSKAVIMALAAMIAGSLVIFLVIKGISSPLNHLAQGIKALGSEGVTGEIPVESKDEIGRLAMAFNEMSESLRERRAENLSLEMQLRQVQKLEALGTLAGGIAHDFNNVLSPIVGFTELAMDDVPKDGELYNDLQEIFNAAIRARDLVKQILAFSRQAKSERVPLKVQLIVKEVLKLLRATLPTTIALTRHIDENCGPVLADPTDMHRIIMNLCTNAFHAMRDQGGELKVTLENCVLGSDERVPSLNLPSGKYLKLTVSDTGVGMDEATRERIFDPYFTTKLPGEGTGMGLAVVHGIVKSCDGDILVFSERGKGTTFELYFPRIESDAEGSESLDGEPVPGGNEHILLVDDEAQIVFMMRQMLNHLGYRVTTRTSSIEALEVFAVSPGKFDIIITDQTMPNMTGDELALKLMSIRKDIPVIICTGFSEKISEEKARKKGIRALLMKPVIKQEMARTIREVLDS
jgi:signal transduction histidine kinase/CheY-like chemotaxis protein